MFLYGLEQHNPSRSYFCWQLLNFSAVMYRCTVATSLYGVAGGAAEMKHRVLFRMAWCYSLNVLNSSIEAFLFSRENKWFKLVTHSPSQIFRDSFDRVIKINICTLVFQAATWSNMFIHLGIATPDREKEGDNGKHYMSFVWFDLDIIYCVRFGNPFLPTFHWVLRCFCLPYLVLLLLQTCY